MPQDKKIIIETPGKSKKKKPHVGRKNEMSYYLCVNMCLFSTLWEDFDVTEFGSMPVTGNFMS